MVAARQAWNARLTTEPGALFNYVNPCLGLFIVALHLGACRQGVWWALTALDQIQCNFEPVAFTMILLCVAL